MSVIAILVLVGCGLLIASLFGKSPLWVAVLVIYVIEVLRAFARGF